MDWSRTALGPVATWSPRLRTIADVVLDCRYPMIVLWKPGAIHAVYNDAYARLIGKRHPRAMGEQNETIWPEVWHINGPLIAAVLAEGREFYFEDALYPLERNDWREEVYLTIAYSPIRDGDAIGGVLVTMLETTRNVLAERRLRSLSELAARMARLRSVEELAAIALDVLVENTGDVLFALIFTSSDAQRAGATGVSLLGRRAIDEADALDLSALTLAIVGDGGSALVRLGQLADDAPRVADALGQPVRDAFVASLPFGGAAESQSFVAIGMSPALVRDAVYLEYFELIRAQLATAFENATLFSRERRIADTLQRAALPGKFARFPGLTVDAVYEAGSDEARIGGDWYDAFTLHDGRVVLSIGDVAGSGVVAAAAMSAARQMIRGLAQTLDDPAHILDAVDRAFRLDPDSPIITAFVGFIAADRRGLRFASAGHPPPLLRRPDGTVEPLAGTDLPIGLRDASRAAPRSAALVPGDILVLYTDGLTEATRDAIEGERRLSAALQLPAILAAERKAAYVYECVLERRATDDIALLVIEFG